MNFVSGITLRGVEAIPVEVEVVATEGMFNISVVGLPDAAVREARERIRAALRSLGVFLRGHISINLAPADIPKEGALLDLPMAVSTACANGEIKVPRPSIFIGELALDGRLRGVRGAVPAAILARKLGVDLYVPEENAREIGLVDGVRAWKVAALPDLIAHLNGTKELELVERLTVADETPPHINPDFSDIKGQAIAKRALEIAAAGHHNILFVGSPGSGKTLLARALKGILPPLSDHELMDVLLLRSTAGIPFSLLRERPFRTVHHTASSVAICGGGTNLRPGEISLASRGVLFLDEFPEFSRDVLEAMRQPLEDGQITVSRASGSVVYPARVLMVAACNPCPCGYAGDVAERCKCPTANLERYRRKLSGPILDRIDLHIAVPRLTPSELISLEGRNGESSAEVRCRVVRARKKQTERWASFGIECNSELPENILRRNMKINDEIKGFLTNVLNRTKLSGRGLSRVFRVSRTIADLEGAEGIELHHVAEALSYREGEALSWMKS